MGIGKNKLKVVGESLESRPFAGGHLAYSFAIDLPLDVCHRGEIRKAVVDYEVPFATHSAADKCGRDSIEILDFISESMACGLMSGPVLSQGLQVHVAEIILHGDGFLLHDVGDLGLRVGGLGELECGAVDIVSERDDVYALPVLGYAVVFAVKDLVQRGVPHVFQCIDDDVEGSAFVMDRETLDILAEYHLGTVEVTDSDDIEEQGSAGHTFVIVLESLFSACDGERLARESSQTDVKVGHVLLIDFRDVAIDLGRSVEVGFVGLLCVLIPFAGEHCLDLVAEGSVESHTDSAYSREQIDGSVDLSVSHVLASNTPYVWVVYEPAGVTWSEPSIRLCRRIPKGSSESAFPRNGAQSSPVPLAYD